MVVQCSAVQAMEHQYGKSANGVACNAMQWWPALRETQVGMAVAPSAVGIACLSFFVEKKKLFIHSLNWLKHDLPCVLRQQTRDFAKLDRDHMKQT